MEMKTISVMKLYPKNELQAGDLELVILCRRNRNEFPKVKFEMDSSKKSALSRRLFNYPIEKELKLNRDNTTIK